MFEAAPSHTPRAKPLPLGGSPILSEKGKGAKGDDDDGSGTNRGRRQSNGKASNAPRPAWLDLT